MIWGLLANDGTSQSPHLYPSDDNFTSSPHYIMFNARSETVDTKKSFCNLLREGKTCIFAVDGYYEWTKSLSPIDKKKQPYFITTSSSSNPMLLAGLWSQVKTGRLSSDNKEETISTFTILTTEANHVDLHPREPVIIHDSTVAREWLVHPSKDLLYKIRSLLSGLQQQHQHHHHHQQQQPNCKVERNDNDAPWENKMIVYYPVTKKMNDASYQGDDCTVELKSKVRTLESYFGGQTDDTCSSLPPAKLQKVDGKKQSSEYQYITSSSEKYEKPKSSSEEDVSNEAPVTEANNNEWSCAVCTFRHVGSKTQYLVCDMCGSKRECNEGNTE
jgi:putative SOS response-associated peptidase YedK